MNKVKVIGFRFHGYRAGIHQDLQDPIGMRDRELHTWIYPTKAFQKMMGKEGGTEGIDNSFIEKSFENVAAWVIGRNMFGLVRGKCPNEEGATYMRITKN